MSDYRQTPDTEEDEQEEETPSRHRVRHYKKEEVMRQECHDFVMARKRLPILHSRWLFNRYINCYTHAVASMPEHNRMVDELRETKEQLRQAHVVIQALNEQLALRS